MSEPRTAAGRALLGFRGYHSKWTEARWIESIIAIEDEARSTSRDSEADDFAGERWPEVPPTSRDSEVREAIVEAARKWNATRLDGITRRAAVPEDADEMARQTVLSNTIVDEVIADEKLAEAVAILDR